MAGELAKLFAPMPPPNPVRQMERGQFYDPWGNPIDPNRPAIRNPDGSISTERTATEMFTVPDDRPWINFPTVVNGQQLSLGDALQALLAGQEQPTGRFRTLQEAESAARDRTNYLGILESFGAIGRGGNGR